MNYKNVEEIRTNPLLDPPPHSCFNCWSFGHNANGCPKPRNGFFCTNCGRIDRIVSNCERCKKAYFESKNLPNQTEERNRVIVNPRNENWNLNYRFPLPDGVSTSRGLTVQNSGSNSQAKSRTENRSSQLQPAQSQSRKIHQSSKSLSQSNQPRSNIHSRLGPRLIQSNFNDGSGEVQERESQALRLLRELRDVDEETRIAILKSVYSDKK